MPVANSMPAIRVIRKIDETARTRVMIVEDHDLLAQSVSLALRLEGFEVELSRGPHADDVLSAARVFRPGVVLLDFHLGDDLGIGRDLVAPLSELGARIVMVSGSMSARDLAECVEAGCEGFVDKARSFDDLLQAVRAASRGEELLPPSRRTDLLLQLREQRILEQARSAILNRLTDREVKVLAALTDGKAAEQIAASFCVAPTTVRSQIHSILQKLGVNSQLAAVALARQLGWEPDSAPGNRGQ